MAEDAGPKGTPDELHSRVDGWINRVLGNVAGAISTFVAFLFILFTLGAVYGYLVILKIPHLAPLLIAIPAVLGLFAYYSRGFAILVFILIIAFIILI